MRQFAIYNKWNKQTVIRDETFLKDLVDRMNNSIALDLLNSPSQPGVVISDNTQTIITEISPPQ